MRKASPKQSAKQPAKRPIKLDERGQISIELDSTNFILRPSVEAIMEAENETGLSLFDLASLASNARMRLDQMGVTVAALMKAHGKANPTDPLVKTYVGSKPERLAELIFEAGPAHINAALSIVLSGALTGGYTPSGEPKAAMK